MVKIERKNIIIYSRLFNRTINRYFSVAFVLISLVFRSVIFYIFIVARDANILVTFQNRTRRRRRVVGGREAAAAVNRHSTSQLQQRVWALR